MSRGRRTKTGVLAVVELPLGTLVSGSWTKEWVDVVRAAEERTGRAICGALRRSAMTEQGERLPCRLPAGHGTSHRGEGRCRRHGGDTGNVKNGRTSLLRHRQLSALIEDYLDSAELLDMRQAIATSWAAVDEILEDDGMITPDRVDSMLSAMRTISGMIKSHHDMTEGQKIVIEVPQFMSWAEDLYSVAIRYIQNAGGDVGGFLREAQNYYASTVGATIDVGGISAPALGDGGAGATDDAARPELEEP